MDDNQKIVDQNTNTPPAVSGIQPQAQNPAQTIQNQPQAQSVGAPNKEQEPARGVVEKSDVELKIDKELEDIGVEVKSDDVNLTAEHTQAGLQHSGTSVPVSTAETNIVVQKQSSKQIKKEIKKTKPTDSLRGRLLEVLKDAQRTDFKEEKV